MSERISDRADQSEFFEYPKGMQMFQLGTVFSKIFSKRKSH